MQKIFPGLMPRASADPLSGAFEMPAISALLAMMPPEPPETGPAPYSAMWDPAPKAPLSVYANVPFCPTFCPFCGFFKVRHDPEAESAYVDALVSEARAEGELADQAGLKVEALFVGGGTPTVLSADLLGKLLAGLRCAFPLADDYEWTLEARASTFDAEKMALAWDSGVNRVSIGVQSFDGTVRNGAGRADSGEEAAAGVKAAVAGARGAVAVDLMFGLPGQSLEIFARDLATAVEAGVSGVSAYLLKPMPWREGGEPWPPEPTPVSELAAYFRKADEILRGQGFVRRIRSHWSRDPRDRSLYNLLVSGRRDMIGVGAAAGGFIQGRSYSNIRDIGLYIEAATRGEKPLRVVRPVADRHEILDEASLVLARGLIPYGLLGNPAWTAPPVADLVSLWKEAGLVEDAEGGLRITLAGYFWHWQMEGGLRAAFSSRSAAA
ncbi:MAG: radical SAM protein [Deltaproteobacteria bacterium]|nr:radical SAM protein [Deltaproteobacteria bacterium]